MTSRQRIVLLVIAAVVLVGGVLLASSSGGDDSDSTETTAAQEQQQTVQTSTAGETVKKEAPAGPTVEVIRIVDGKPAGGVKTLKYDNGETIALRFTSNTGGEVHIHGYDNEFELEPGVAKVVRFKADLEGIFEVEDHETEELLAKLQVSPK